MIRRYENVRKAYKSKIAVVMTTFIKERDEENRKALLFAIDNIKYFTPGIKFDFFIVDNGSNDEEWMKIVDNGQFKVFHRPNLGFSFGGYKHAYEILKDEYDYFLFMEQDVTPTKAGWLKQIFDMFYSRPDVGVVVNAIENSGYNHDYYPHVLRYSGISGDGLFYFTSTDILNKCGLRINEGESQKEYMGLENEMLFIQTILEYGYSVFGMFKAGEWITEYSYCHGSNAQWCTLKSEEPKKLAKTITPLITAHCITEEKLGHIFRQYFNYQTGKTYVS